MALAERTDESAEDITAAEIAPRPKNETHFGVRYCKTRGSTSLVSETVVLSFVKIFGEALDQSKISNKQPFRRNNIQNERLLCNFLTDERWTF